MTSNPVTSERFRPAAPRVNAMMGALSFGTATLTSFFLTPFVLRSLGDAQYGILSLAGELITYSVAFDFGIRGALGYFVSRFRSEGRPAQADAYVRTAFWVLVFSACAATVVAAGAVWGLPSLFLVDNVDPQEARLAVGILLLVPILNLPWSVPSAVLAGLRRFDVISGVGVVTTILGAMTLAAAIHLGGGLVTVAAIQGGTAALGWVLQGFQLRRLGYSLRLWPASLPRTQVRDILRFGSANMTMGLTQIALLQMDLLVIARIIGAGGVTRYFIGRYLGFHLLTFISSMTMTLPTAFTHHATVGDAVGLRSLYRDASASIGAVACLLASGIFVFGESFIRLWVGAGYVEGPWWDRSDTVLMLMTAAMGVRGVGSVPMQYLFGIRRLRLLTLVRVVESAVHLAGSIVFASWLGLAGVALVKLAVSVVSHLFFVFPYTIRLVGMRYPEFGRAVLLPMAVTGAATALTGLLARSWLPPDTWAVFFADSAMAGAAGLAVAWTTAVPPGYRQEVQEKIRSIGRLTGR